MNEEEKKRESYLFFSQKKEKIGNEAGAARAREKSGVKRMSVCCGRSTLTSAPLTPFFTPLLSCPRARAPRPDQTRKMLEFSPPSGSKGGSKKEKKSECFFFLPDL